MASVEGPAAELPSEKRRRGDVGTAVGGAAVGDLPTEKSQHSKASSLSVLGPPFRWLQIDCSCYYSQNLYARAVDAYFTLPLREASQSEFWAANEGSERYEEEQRHAIYQDAVREAKRRTGIPELYLHNAIAIHERYRPLHPEFFPAPLGTGGLPTAGPEVAPGLLAESVFLPAFLDVWRHARDGTGLPPELKHVHDMCFECPLFTREFSIKIKEELRNFKAQSLQHHRPNSMNRNGCILNEIGFGPLMDRMIGVYLLPVCRVLYPEQLDGGLDSHHSFIVDYAVGEDRDASLGVHDDNSEVTINVALSEDYIGGVLALYHRARVAHPQLLEKTPYHHRVGMGTMLTHPGSLLHEVLPLTSGERMGLIVWLRSDAYRLKNGCPLCRNSDQLLYASAGK